MCLHHLAIHFNEHVGKKKMTMKMDKVDLRHPNCSGVVHIFSNPNTKHLFFCVLSARPAYSMLVTLVGISTGSVVKSVEI